MENNSVTTGNNDNVNNLSLDLNNTHIEYDANNSATGLSGEQKPLLVVQKGARPKAIKNKNEFPKPSKYYEKVDHAAKQELLETDGPKDSNDNWIPVNHIRKNPSHQSCPTLPYHCQCTEDPTAQQQPIVPSCSSHPEKNNEPIKDFIILNAIEDAEKAVEVRDHLLNDFPRVQPAITVELFSNEDIGKLEMESLLNLPYQCRRILILVTDNLCKRKPKFYTTLLQTFDLENNDNKYDRIVPVWTCDKLDFWQLKPLKGLNYWRAFGKESSRNLYRGQVDTLVKMCRKKDR